MNRKQAIHILKRYRPLDVDDLTGILKVTHLDGGCFREAYHITGTRLVIKFPIEKSGIYHTRRELQVMKSIATKSKFRHLARYCPRVFYTDYRRGIVVMELLGDVGRVDDEVCRIVEKMFQETLGSRANFDLSHSNLGRGVRGQVKVLDFGCVRGSI